MRFYLTVALLIAIAVFGVKKCAGRGKGNSGLLPSPAAAATAALLPDEKAVKMEVPPASMLYIFKNRPVPEFENLTNSSKGDGISAFVDKLSNSVLFRGNQQEVGSLIIAMRQIDVPGDEAFVDASLLFVRGDRVRDFEAGVSYKNGPSIAGSLSLSPGGFGVVLPAGAVSLNLNFLAENGTLEVLDRPQVRVASGETSLVSTGEDVAVPVTVFENGIARSSIDFKKVGLSFSVQPFFLGDGRARLNISAENGLVGDARKVGDVEVPQISTQKVTSVVTLGTDDGILVGGLETVRRSRRFGIFGDKETAETGRLYLCLVLRSGIPKAISLDGASMSDDWLTPPRIPTPAKVKRSFFGLFGRDETPADGMVLPSKNWESQEKEFIKSKGSK